MAAVQTSNILNTLRKEVSMKLEMDMETSPPLMRQVFKKVNAPLIIEQRSDLTGAATATEYFEGMAVPEQIFNQRFSDSIKKRHFVVSMFYSMFAEHYAKAAGNGNIFEYMRAEMKRAHDNAEEAYAARFFNLAFSGATYADGKTLCATDHPNTFGTQANMPSVATSLGEAALEDALTALNYFKDDGGKQIVLKFKKLVGRPSDVFNMQRLLKSQGRVDTANNDINALVASGQLTYDMFVTSPHITVAALFGITDVAHGFEMHEGFPLKTDELASADGLGTRVIAVRSYALAAALNTQLGVYAITRP